MKDLIKVLGVFWVVSLFIVSCKKDTDEPIISGIPLEPYIKSLILPDTNPPYTGSFYMHIKFKNESPNGKNEIMFSQSNQDISVWYNPVDAGLGMSIQGVHLRDPKTDESLEISFYFNTKTDTTFNICYANYFFNDPWRNIAGANIHYFIPVGISNPGSQYMYLGTNSSNSYFKITYIGYNRINGTFSTRFNECCGGKNTYDVSGDFSIPDIRYYPN